MTVAKPVVWVGTARGDLRGFPKVARSRGGYEIYRVQHGLEPTDWKPMATVGAGVREIRIHTELEHRVLYVAKFADAVYVLHAFEKKTRKTSKEDIALAQRRLRDVLRDRRAASARVRKG